MRVTNRMLSQSFLTDMSHNMGNLKKLQKQITTEKNFSKPSDDPAAVVRSMQLHSSIDANSQYNKNITNVVNHLDTTDTALGQLGDYLTTIREKLISAGNAGYGKDERKAIKDEINEIIGGIGQVLNTNVDGRYVFSGTRVTSKPLDAVDDGKGNMKLIYLSRDGKEMTSGSDEYKMLGEKLKSEISQGVTMEYNVGVTNVMEFKGKAQDGTPKDYNLIGVLNNIVSHLDGTKSKDIKELVNGDLHDLDQVSNNSLKIRAEVGAKQNRMESVQEMNKQSNFDMTEILSKEEDVNITEKLMEFAVMRSVYMASLQTSAKVLQPTLMDYLR